jgi:hypothetical protein
LAALERGASTHFGELRPALGSACVPTSLHRVGHVFSENWCG